MTIKLENSCGLSILVSCVHGIAPKYPRLIAFALPAPERYRIPIRKTDDLGAKERDHLGENEMHINRLNGNMQCIEVGTKMKIG
jgi:hypothetical protein